VKLLLLGADGQLGWELQRALSPLGEVRAVGRAQLDLEDSDALRACVRAAAPRVVVNAAAYTQVDRAETEPDRVRRVNARAVAVLAEACSVLRAWVVHYSTDYVFDGRKGAPYVETDAVGPLNAYGRSKLESERLLASMHPQHLILRTSWLYARRGHNFPSTILRLAARETSLQVVDDQIGSPTSAALVADVTALALHRMRSADTPLFGTYHVAARGQTSWFDFARHLLDAAQRASWPLRCTAAAIVPVRSATRAGTAVRPAYSSLDPTRLESTFGLQLPDWRYHADRLIAALSPDLLHPDLLHDE